MVAAQSPTLARIKKEASETDARALLYIAICEVCDFFNVGKNMNDTQVALTVDMILESFWYLKLEEIKYCFRRAMMREKLFDRLDGNIIIGWLRDYDAERTNEAISLSDRQERQRQNEIKPDADAKGYQEYIARLKGRAKTDKSAADLLSQINDSPISKATTALSREDRALKEREFKKWHIFDYLFRKTK